MMSVEDYFEGKNIFITGGSGFLGKLLIEKLLRSCPTVGNIYILLRPKKGVSIEERLEEIKASSVFHLLRQENVKALDKIFAVKGDVCEIDLGLNESDRKMLIENVNIIYNSAASVRFDDFLKKAIILNVRGTREVVKLALELKHISILVHISSTYGNCDKLKVEEKIYEAHTPWRDAISIAEECDETLINSMTAKYIRPLPNTYTFTKSLAEHVVNELCKGKIPSVIVRPSVMTHTQMDPSPGWTDNFNGPFALIAAGGKGFLRVILAKRDSIVDYIPADFVIKGVILATSVNASKSNLEETEVYNSSQNTILQITQQDMVSLGLEMIKHYPFSKLLWNPKIAVTHCWYNYYIQVILFHMLPAILVDTLLRIAGKKTMLVNMQRKVYIGNTVLEPFMTNSFCFINEKLQNLQKSLKKEDNAFAYKYDRFSKEELFEFFKYGKFGIATYLLKERFDLLGDRSKNNLKNYWYLDMIVKILFFTVLFWFVTFKSNLLNNCFYGLDNYIRSLN